MRPQWEQKMDLKRMMITYVLQVDSNRALVLRPNGSNGISGHYTNTQTNKDICVFGHLTYLDEPNALDKAKHLVVEGAKTTLVLWQRQNNDSEKLLLAAVELAQKNLQAHRDRGNDHEAVLQVLHSLPLTGPY